MIDHPPKSMAWHDGFLLGHGPMDEIHHEFVSQLARLAHAPREQVRDELEALRVHCRRHFEEEERWMTETDFPGRECHAAEHLAVLRSLDGICQKVDQGDTAAATRLAQALAEWFPAHADYLDAPLSHWLSKRRLGGKPVVLRRRLPGQAPASVR